MNWQDTYNNLQLMKGMELQSISGRSNVAIIHINEKHLILDTPNGTRTRATSELRQIVNTMDLLSPIHVDSVLHGSGSSRNQPETILANMPDVEWMHLNRCKHIVWVGRQTHLLGSVKKLDAFNSAKMREQYRDRGPLTGQVNSKFVILAQDVRLASDFVNTLFHTTESAASSGGNAYRIRHEYCEIIIIPEIHCQIPDFEIIPLIPVIDLNEALARIQTLYPQVEVKSYNIESPIILVTFGEHSSIAFESYYH